MKLDIMCTTVCDLTPRNGRKSFGGKAKIIIDRKTMDEYLQSYCTIVCKIDRKKGIVIRFPHYESGKTWEHIKSFLIANGYEMTKQQFYSLPEMTVEFSQRKRSVA